MYVTIPQWFETFPICPTFDPAEIGQHVVSTERSYRLIQTPFKSANYVLLLLSMELIFKLSSSAKQALR